MNIPYTFLWPGWFSLWECLETAQCGIHRGRLDKWMQRLLTQTFRKRFPGHTELCRTWPSFAGESCSSLDQIGYLGFQHSVFSLWWFCYGKIILVSMPDLGMYSLGGRAWASMWPILAVSRSYDHSTMFYTPAATPTSSWKHSGSTRALPWVSSRPQSRNRRWWQKIYKNHDIHHIKKKCSYNYSSFGSNFHRKLCFL